jgi:hypothetical protein
MTEAKGMLESNGTSNGAKGTMDLDVLLPDTPENTAKREQFLQFERETKKRMSPAGALNLPKLLDARRLEWGIIDAAFERQAAFERILIWQIPEQKGETFGEGSRILMSDQSKARLKNEAPRGIVISAGLRALDSLRSNGIDLGHIVNFIQAAPWRIFVDYMIGYRPAVLMMNAGDIIGSEDLATILRKGDLRVDVAESERGPIHVYKNKTGDFDLPTLPWVGDDM